jgi:hypothetical protein
MKTIVVVVCYAAPDGSNNAYTREPQDQAEASTAGANQAPQGRTSGVPVDMKADEPRDGDGSLSRCAAANGRGGLGDPAVIALHGEQFEHENARRWAWE